MRIELPELRRCCICLPLRQGLLVLGYFNIVLCVTLASLVISEVLDPYITIHMGRVFHLNFPVTLLAIMYLLEVIFNIVLVCGIHMFNRTTVRVKNKMQILKDFIQTLQRRVLLLRIYYYFMIAIFVLSFIVEIIEVSVYPHSFIESIFLYMATFSLNLYVLFLVRSLIKKFEISERQAYGNQLQNFINGELDTNARDPCSNISSEKEIV